MGFGSRLRTRQSSAFQFLWSTWYLKLNKGREPTVNLVRQHCPKATVNPDTGEYFDKKLILDVFKNECFDKGARLPWGHLPPVS